MLTSDGMDLSVKRVSLYDEKTAPVNASSTKCLLLFVQRNSRKRTWIMELWLVALCWHNF